MGTRKSWLPLMLVLALTSACCAKPEVRYVAVTPPKLQVPEELLTPPRRQAMDSLMRFLQQSSPSETPTTPNSPP